MIRRKFVSVIPLTGCVLFSGCINRLDPQNSEDDQSSDNDQRPKGGLHVQNRTDTNQTVEILIRDEDNKTVHSDQWELGKDFGTRNLSFWAEVGSTYNLEVTTNDYQEEFEWEVEEPEILLIIQIRDSGIRFSPSPPEG